MFHSDMVSVRFAPLISPVPISNSEISKCYTRYCYDTTIQVPVKTVEFYQADDVLRYLEFTCFV